jgi:hypothetical protein
MILYHFTLVDRAEQILKPAYCLTTIGVTLWEANGLSG